MSWCHYVASETSTDLPADSIKHGTLEIKEKSYLTDAPPSDMPINTVKLYQPRLLHCQYNLHAE